MTAIIVRANSKAAPELTFQGRKSDRVQAAR